MNSKNTTKNSTVQRVVERAIKSIESEVNITNLANACGVPTVTLWNKVVGRRKWDADTFIKLMAAIGHVKYSGGMLQIKCDLAPHEKLKLDSVIEASNVTHKRRSKR